ncbi:LysE family transporter [Streptomyces sp. NBC_00513]|uniref:LysE family transporter n=1 Tax=unclassified Streptomyces TaxID=2593676 RepID=UPI00225AA76E|nr:LysE family transporter [Streptomyces sp. NBC_00424]MCX5075554.1 LysE family transporter [Streptomyces sp. NBC_00424]WUD41341.1 LysE family transporter [Streptomyces sp. NBC_00513]
MSELMGPAVSGAVAGLGVAMPMGAMSVLLLQEAMRHRGAAVAAATGIAAVDLGYATLATMAGPWVASHVAPVEAWVRLASALVLLVIAARGLRSATAVPARCAAPATTAASGPPAVGTEASRPGRAFGRFVALTAVNPTTALYFVALTTAQGGGLGSGPTGAAFLAGVAVASLLWQQFLVVLGSFAGARVSPAVRVRTFRLGHGLVAGYALKIAFPLPWT